MRSVGFRICLHDATVYPSADSATVLVNASGAGAADWMPTQAGTYQLTHEVQVDGTTVAPMESALFRVEGPVLEIVPLGELTNGVLVRIESVASGSSVANVASVASPGGDDWPIYYTTDGSTPTAGSTKYEGPFALPESATVKAVAISAGGVSSEVASKELALSPALAVEDVAARQRYPWNGMVDIDYTIAGDAAGLKLEIGVEDRQNGKTYTPTKFLSILPTSAGRHRVTWSTEAEGVTIISTNVAVTVSLVRVAPTEPKKELYYVVDLSGGPTATRYPVTTLEASPSAEWSDEYKTTKLVLRRIEAGEDPLNGCIFVGSKGMMASLDPYGNDCILLMNGEKAPRNTREHEACSVDLIPMYIPRVPGKTEDIWIDMDREQTGELCRAIRGQAKCFSDIDYSTGILEGMLVGCMSQRLNRTLAWNAATKRFDDKDANALIRPFVRKGWEF